MAEQMASDPSFQAITQQLAGMGLAPHAGTPAAAAAAEPAESAEGSATRSAPAGATPGAGLGAGGAAAGPVDPEQYMKARLLLHTALPVLLI
jgi:hypothetical protein